MPLSPMVLRPALSYARQAILEYATLPFDGQLLGKGELPTELMTKPNLVLIYLLPRIFRRLGKPQAAQFNEIWQHGDARFKGLKLDARIEGSPYYWLYASEQFLRISPTFRATVSSVLKENVDALSRIGTPYGSIESRWRNLRDFARKLRSANKNKKEWRALSPDFRSTVAHPKILLETQEVTSATYALSGEDPMRSDAYAAVGPSAVRSYLFAEFRKQDGDDNIYVLPRRVGVRIWDDYGFNDSGILDYLSGLFANGEASQFLGNWRDKKGESTISLHNSDFEEYRSWFMPLYNQFLEKRRAGPEKRLRCTDFHPISTWIEEEIKTPTEYPLSPSW